MDLRLSLVRMTVHAVTEFVQSLWFLIRTVVRVSIQLAGVAVSSIWVGIPTAMERISGYWLNMAIDAKVPERFFRPIQFLGSAGAIVMILLGWIIVALVTVIALAALF